METGSEGEMDRNMNRSPAEGAKRPKRQMKTQFQLDVLEDTFSREMYPSEATRAELSEKLNLTDRQLQMWFCHRRLKDKKEAVGTAAMKMNAPGSVGGRDLTEFLSEEMMGSEPGSRHDSRSGSASGSGSSEFDDGDGMPVASVRYYEVSRTTMERRVMACVEEQLGQPLREDGPILGIEFDELPPGAFGAPIVPAEQQDRYRHSYDSKPFGQCDAKHLNVLSSGHHETMESELRFDAHRHAAQPYLYESPADGTTAKKLSIVHGNGRPPWEYEAECLAPGVDIVSQPSRQVQFNSSPKITDFNPLVEDSMQIDRKRKSDEARVGKKIQAHEKKLRKELEKQDLLRRKMEEQSRKDMERQDRERRKEEQRMIREQQKLEEKFQREERRELKRREKFLQKEQLRLEKRKQKEDQRKEKEAARQKAAMERATARRIAKESMELIEDDRLELMELAASSKGLSSIVSLDYDTLQNLDAFREALCHFPPKSVQLRLPFAIEPWINSEENVGDLLMVWKFCVTFSDVLGLWPFTLDEFIQAFHDHDSRLLGELHIALLKLIIKDIEDVVRTPSGGPGTNQYSAVNPEGGHPRIVEGAYLWGFDIRNWQKYLNPLTWPEILRQFALSAGFGPQLKKKVVDRVSANDIDESKGCEDIVSTLRNGSAAENAIAIMQVKGFTLQRRSRHRLTPGTVKFAAYHVLALEGSKGLNVIDLADKIQKSGLRDLTTSKTPEASISVALSRDPIVFERIAPSTYCVRPAFRKDPADAESIIAEAKEKIQKYANVILAGQTVEEEERDDYSDSDVAEGDAMTTPFNGMKNSECNSFGFSPENGKGKLSDDATLLIGNTLDGMNSSGQGFEIDESGSCESWVQGITEGEYSDLSVEERLHALVALIGVANEGNSIRVILEDRLDTANALKKQMWAEAQLDKRRMREETISKLYDSTSNIVAEGGLSELGLAEDKFYFPTAATLEKDASSVPEDARISVDNVAQNTSTGQFTSTPPQNGCASERLSLQLKSYIGHRAEEMYVYRSLPLGQDRRRNRYWQFVASASSLDPGWGRIFVESTVGCWRLIDSEEAFCALLKSLDIRGIRESHLHLMLQKTELYFKECVQRNQLFNNNLDQGRNDDLRVFEVDLMESFSRASVESPRSAVCSTNSDLRKPSSSFKIDPGRNESKERNFLKRYRDLHTWMWKECFNFSIMCAKKHGSKRGLPLLGICDMCLGTHEAEENLCPYCQWMYGHVKDQEDFLEHFNHEIDFINNGTKTAILNASSPSIKLIKAMLTLLEVSLPPEGLHSHWMEECRIFWGSLLQNSSSAKDLLQLLTQFEGAIERDYLSVEFETTEELLCHCASSMAVSSEFPYPGSVPPLPWIPETTAAVALRLFELDASIFYTPNLRAEFHEKKADALPNFTSKFPSSNNTPKVEIMEFDKHGLIIKEDNWDYRDTLGRSGDRNVARNRGGGRSRGKLRKGVRPTSPSVRQSTKQGEMITQILMQQRITTNGQKHGRGRRTVRRRRTEKKAVTEILQSCLDDKSTHKNVVKNPRNSVRDKPSNFDSRNEVENDDSGNSMEVDDYDDNTNESLYEFAKWGTSPYTATPNRSNEMMEMSEEEADEVQNENIYEEDDAGIARGLELNYEDSDQDVDSNREEGSESSDYSD